MDTYFRHQITWRLLYALVHRPLELLFNASHEDLTLDGPVLLIPNHGILGTGKTMRGKNGVASATSVGLRILTSKNDMKNLSYFGNTPMKNIPVILTSMLLKSGELRTFPTITTMIWAFR